MIRLARFVVLLCLVFIPVASALAQTAAAPKPAEAKKLGALAKENLLKPRSKPPFDLTGVWDFSNRRNQANGGGIFTPIPKLKPAAQAMYDASVKALAEGKSFMDDTANCWPPGMPKLFARVWPLQIVQLPTVIIVISAFENQVRWIYLDGRDHADPDIATSSYNGDSVGHWEGDTLVIDSTNFEKKKHWVMTGIPISDQFHMVERIRMIDGGKGFEDEFTMTDPVQWEGEWVNKKIFTLNDEIDIEEMHCLPDTNSYLPSTQSATAIKSTR